MKQNESVQAAPAESGQSAMPPAESGGIPRNLTRQELMELESSPKSFLQIAADRFICASPILMGILSLLEYFLVPNCEGCKSTMLYAYFIGLLTLAFCVFFLCSLFRKQAFYKLRSKAPFYTLVFVLLTIYDILTLKTATLILPYFPWVDQIFNAFFSDTAYLLESVRSSLYLLMTGYVWGVGTGLLTGVACGYSKRVNYWISPFQKLLGAIPSVTWIPITMILMKTLFQASVFVIALGVWFSVSIACITGITTIDKGYFEAARTLGAKGSQLIFKIAIPSAVPNIFQGMTQGMSTACMALISAEMIGSEAGLGWYITWQRSWAQYAKMYAAIVLLCIIFVAVNFFMNIIRRRFLRWNEVEVGR